MAISNTEVREWQVEAARYLVERYPWLIRAVLLVAAERPQWGRCM